MWRNTAAGIGLGVLISLAGCGKPDAPVAPVVNLNPGPSGGQADAPNAETPQGAVTIFLSAVCAGNDDHAASMLTDLARQKTSEMDLEVAPPGSDTAQFRIGEVDMLADGAARVACTWSDLDEEGLRQEEQILWVLRREPQGWRIAGMAPTIFPGEPPLLLNFEDPEEMFEKLEWVQQEALRRAQAELMQGAEGVRLEAQRPEAQGDEVRR